MCGIIGYVGHQQAAPILLDGLARMEYRGYDSAGVAVRSETKGLQVYKSKGRLQVLSDMIHDGTDVEGTLGIGHTRWATHGEPNDINAHPHVSEDGRIAMVLSLIHICRPKPTSGSCVSAGWEPSSKQARLIRHWRRFACFPAPLKYNLCIN